jgi:predicted nucleic acid-binding protein
MVEFPYPAKTLTLSRRLIMLDTNVLIDAFGADQTDAGIAAKMLLEESDYQLLLPAVVIVEAWGLLARDSWSRAWKMVAWAADPGTQVIILERRGEVRAELPLQGSLTLDHVDAAIAILATEVTRECRLTPPLEVATRDFRDFSRVAAADDIELRLLDYTQVDW